MCVASRRTVVPLYDKRDTGHMRLITLGTSCAQQSPSRTQSAHALAISPAVTYLFDCGSSTATSLLRAGIKYPTIHKVFITHLHTDHVIGLTGLLTDILGGHGGKVEDFRAGMVREGPNRRILDVYGPCGLKELLRTTFRLTYTMLTSSFRVHELLLEGDQINADPPFIREEGSRDIRCSQGAWKAISTDDHFTVTAVPITHSVPSLGFVITENSSVTIPDHYVAQLKEGCKGGSAKEFQEAMRSLKAGESVQVGDLHLPRLASVPGRQVVILGDTSDASAVAAHVSPPVSLVLHESTNAYLPRYCKPSDTLKSVRDRAIERGHSTPEMAGEFARLCQSSALVLTHFSSRYSGADNHGAVKVMQAFESIAGLAGTATQESVEALFSRESTPKKMRKDQAGNTIKGAKTYNGTVIAAWDGMVVDIPR